MNSLRQAFTLLELLLSLAILVLISVGTLLLTRSAFQVGLELEDHSKDTGKQQAILAVLREHLSSLPAQSILEIKATDSGSALLIHQADSFCIIPQLWTNIPIQSTFLGQSLEEKSQWIIRWHQQLQPNDFPQEEAIFPPLGKEINRVVLFNNVESSSWRLATRTPLGTLSWHDSSHFQNSTSLQPQSPWILAEFTWKNVNSTQTQQVIFSLHTNQDFSDPDFFPNAN